MGKGDEKRYEIRRIFAISKEDLQKCMQHINEKCKNDSNFMRHLKENPTETLTNEGVKLQPGIRFQTVKNEEEAKKLPENVIPFAIQEKKKGAVSPDELKEVAGGFNWGRLQSCVVSWGLSEIIPSPGSKQSLGRAGYGDW